MNIRPLADRVLVMPAKTEEKKDEPEVEVKDADAKKADDESKK